MELDKPGGKEAYEHSVDLATRANRLISLAKSITDSVIALQLEIRKVGPKVGIDNLPGVEEYIASSYKIAEVLAHNSAILLKAFHSTQNKVDQQPPADNSEQK